MTIQCDRYGMTDIGKERSLNEDQFLIADMHKLLVFEQGSLPINDGTWLWGGGHRRLFLVADGVGANPEGKQASAIATQTISNYVLNTIPWFYLLREDEENDLVSELTSAMERCNRVVENICAIEGEPKHPATTMTLAYLLWPRLYVVHVGHSRCYLLRDKELHQITTDHTYAQRMVEMGSLNPKNVKASPLRKILWNTIGGKEKDVHTEVQRVILNSDDKLLLCTDGVTRNLSDERISTIMAQGNTSEAIVKDLVRESNDAGGEDNITAVVAHFPNTTPEIDK